jgi:hypothetical protein
MLPDNPRSQRRTRPRRSCRRGRSSQRHTAPTPACEACRVRSRALVTVRAWQPACLSSATLHLLGDDSAIAAPSTPPRPTTRFLETSGGLEGVCQAPPHKPTYRDRQEKRAGPGGRPGQRQGHTHTTRGATRALSEVGCIRSPRGTPGFEKNANDASLTAARGRATLNIRRL